MFRCSPFTLDVNLRMGHIGLNTVSAKDLAWAIDAHENSNTSLAAAIERAKAKALPTVQELAVQAIQRKQGFGKNVVSDRAHLTKLSMQVSHKSGKFRLGALKVHEVTQSHLTSWVKAVMALPGKNSGETLSPHSVELAVAMVKLAWKELVDDEDQAIYVDNLNFENISRLYESGQPRFVDRRPFSIDHLRCLSHVVEIPFESGVFALLLAGLRMNEIGAVRVEDITTDDSGQLWLEPTGSISATKRIWRNRTKVGWRENRTIPISKYQERLLKLAAEMSSTYICGEPLAGTEDIRKCFHILMERAGIELVPGQECKMFRHTVLIEVKRCTSTEIGEAWGHHKHPDSTSSRHYDLREIREKRNEALEKLIFKNSPACDYLPWANW